MVQRLHERVGSGPHVRWVQTRIESCQYASVSDYARDLIRRDQVRIDERQALVAALLEGERSGINKRRVRDILAAVTGELRGKADDATDARSSSCGSREIGTPWSKSHDSREAG